MTDGGGRKAEVGGAGGRSAKAVAGTLPIETPRKEVVDAAALDVINHLLFHKALIDEDDDGSRIADYISMLEADEEGEHVAIRDPFDRAIAMAFELVTQEHMDPWSIDLVQFSQLYLKRAREDPEMDLITAGRIILLAWTVLKLQSDRLVTAAEKFNAPPAPEEFAWDSIPDWAGMSEAEWGYTERVINAPIAPIDEKVRHKADRKVTLMELVDALEEARREAEERSKLLSERAATRAKLARQGRDAVRGMMHRDDPEADEEMIWQRILAKNGHEIPLNELYPGEDLDELVTAFNSVLFLASNKKVWLRQEQFPWGPIWVTNLERAEVHPAKLEEQEDRKRAREEAQRLQEEDALRKAALAERLRQGRARKPVGKRAKLYAAGNVATQEAAASGVPPPAVEEDHPPEPKDDEGPAKPQDDEEDPDETDEGSDWADDTDDDADEDEDLEEE